MKYLLNNLTVLLLFTLALLACDKKYEGQSSLDSVKYNTNTKSYPVTKIDSVQAINIITKQKLQELYDLSTLYASGNKDTEIDSVIFAQMQSYFLPEDSGKIRPLLKELETNKVRFAKVNKIAPIEEIKGADTLNFVDYDVDYFTAQRSPIGNFKKKSRYILKKAPVKFKQEFKFYFLDLDFGKPKDSVGVIK